VYELYQGYSSMDSVNGSNGTSGWTRLRCCCKFVRQLLSDANLKVHANLHVATGIEGLEWMRLQRRGSLENDLWGLAKEERRATDSAQVVAEQPSWYQSSCCLALKCSRRCSSAPSFVA